MDKGYKFVSETDTEVIAHMLDYYYKGDPLEAIRKVMHRAEGAYALGIIFKEDPDKLYKVIDILSFFQQQPETGRS